MPHDPRPIALAFVGLAACDWPVTVGELRDDAAADRVAVVSDVGRDSAADVPADAGCAAPRVACGAACVDLASDPANCGACGVVCTRVATCAAGACAGADAGADAGGCTTGFGDCDRNAANGCETDFLNDRNHCGACGAACPAAQACALGLCR